MTDRNCRISIIL